MNNNGAANPTNASRDSRKAVARQSRASGDRRLHCKSLQIVADSAVARMERRRRAIRGDYSRIPLRSMRATPPFLDSSQTRRYKARRKNSMSGVNEIRSAFLDYFAKHGHTIVPSSPL